MSQVDSNAAVASMESDGDPGKTPANGDRGQSHALDAQEFSDERDATNENADNDEDAAQLGRRSTRKRKQVKYDVFDRIDEDTDEDDVIEVMPSSSRKRIPKFRKAPVIELNAEGGAKLREMLKNPEKLLEQFMLAAQQDKEAREQKKKKPEVVYPDMRAYDGKATEVYTVASVVQTLKQWFVELNKHLSEVHGLRVHDGLNDALAKATGSLVVIAVQLFESDAILSGMTRTTLLRYLSKDPHDNEPIKKGQPQKVIGKDLQLLKEVVRENLPTMDDEKPPTVRALHGLYLARKHQQDPKYKLSAAVFRKALKKAKFRWRKKHVAGQRPKFYVRVEQNWVIFTICYRYTRRSVNKQATTAQQNQLTQYRSRSGSGRQKLSVMMSSC